MRLQAKRKQRGKRLGREEAKVSVRIPRSGSRMVVRFRNARCGFCGGRCSYLMLWRVVFTLSISAIASIALLASVRPSMAPISLLARLQAKRTQRKIGWEGKSKSQRAHSKERIKQGGRPLQECTVRFVCGGRCSYSMLWRVVFTLSASANAMPPSAPRSLPLSLQAKETEEKRLGR